jgi:hypothetical protein
MSQGIDRPITWRTIFRVGLIWGAEYALLSLIEDAPTAVKVATIVCALSALAALEAETWLNTRHRYAFASAVTVVGLVYLAFVMYGINRVADKVAVREGLKQIYTSSRSLADRDIPRNLTKGTLDEKAVDLFHQDFQAWEKGSANWIEKHLGPAARDKFLDRGSMPALSMWAGTWNSIYDSDRDYLAADRRNLFDIMESKTYGD